MQDRDLAVDAGNSVWHENTAMLNSPPVKLRLQDEKKVRRKGAQLGRPTRSRRAPPPSAITSVFATMLTGKIRHPC